MHFILRRVPVGCLSARLCYNRGHADVHTCANREQKLPTAMICAASCEEKLLFNVQECAKLIELGFRTCKSWSQMSLDGMHSRHFPIISNNLVRESRLPVPV